jgi:hypothetical protein
MAIDYGSDFGGVMDLSPSLGLVSGRLALAQAIARRLTTPRGSLFYDPDYGYDLRQHLNAPAPRLGVVEAQTSTEVLKDERVLDVEVDVTFTEGLLSVTLRLFDAGGPFSLVLNVSQVTVELLAEHT